MHTTLAIILALVMGAIVAVYLPMNSAIARHIDSSFMANVIFFGVAFVTAIGIYLVFDPGSLKQDNALSRLGNVPPYMFLTGFVSAFFILGTIFLVPQLGARKMFVLIVTGQIIMAILISHFGVLESPKDPVTLKKLTGAVVVMLGAYISTA